MVAQTPLPPIILRCFPLPSLIAFPKMPGQVRGGAVIPLEASSGQILGPDLRPPGAAPLPFLRELREGGRCPESPLTKPAGQPTSWPLAQLHLVACTDAA